MFEDSLFESQLRAVSPRERWTAVVSTTLQASIASLLVVGPLLHTELMPVRGREVAVVMPLPVPPPPPKTVVQQASSAMASMMPVLGRMLAAPRITPHGIDVSVEPVATLSGPFAGFSESSLPGALAGDTGTARVAVTPVLEKKTGPIHVSSGVSAGLLLAPIRPVYPQIAKAAHVEGTVIVEAMISKTGKIESLRVVSGPPMLQASALEAIRAARYRPFQLNGEPTEVQTTITVNFRMAG